MFPCEKKIEKDIITDRFNNLPHEIASEILTRLPSESVLHCKLVCKNWRNIVDVVINDPSFSFSQKHLYHHLNHPSGKLGFVALTENDGLHFFEYNELTKPIDKPRKVSSTTNFGGYLVGSCNGLTCLARKVPDKTVCICNHFTKEYLLLPEIRTDEYNEYHCDGWSFGFGYLSDTNEYKVVGIHWSIPSGYLEVYVYTIGSGNGWRTLGRNFSLEFIPHNKHGSFANGAIYWIASIVVNKIVTFDLIEEKFCQHLAPPPMPPYRELVCYTIGVLDGFLYIPIYDIGDRCFHVWRLIKKNDSHDKKEGVEHESLGWSKELLRVYDNELLAVTKSGSVLAYTNIYDHINLHDTKTSTSKTLVEFGDRVLQVFPHKHTFVSLTDLGEKHAQKMQSLQGDR